MIKPCAIVIVAPLLMAAAPALAQTADALQGKFAFNVLGDLAREKCVSVAGPLLADFKSANYRCNLTVQKNSASGGAYRQCTAVAKNGKDYMIFDTQRACDTERKTQQANGD